MLNPTIKWYNTNIDFTLPGKMGVIDFLLAIRENLEQRENSTTLAPEVPGYKCLQMLDSQMINYIDTLSNKTHDWSL